MAAEAPPLPCPEVSITKKNRSACEKKTEEINEKQAGSYFHGNKGALMNLNQCPTP